MSQHPRILPAHGTAHAALAQVLPHWPATAADAMRQPLAAAVIRLVSMGLQLGRWGAVPTPPRTARPRQASAAPFDFKRAAAGDRDEQ